jgi:hypothetical protein
MTTWRRCILAATASGPRAANLGQADLPWECCGRAPYRQCDALLAAISVLIDPAYAAKIELVMGVGGPTPQAC